MAKYFYESELFNVFPSSFFLLFFFFHNFPRLLKDPSQFKEEKTAPLQPTKEVIVSPVPQVVSQCDMLP